MCPTKTQIDIFANFCKMYKTSKCIALLEIGQCDHQKASKHILTEFHVCRCNTACYIIFAIYAKFYKNLQEIAQFKPHKA